MEVKLNYLLFEEINHTEEWYEIIKRINNEMILLELTLLNCLVGLGDTFLRD